MVVYAAVCLRCFAALVSPTLPVGWMLCSPVVPLKAGALGSAGRVSASTEVDSDESDGPGSPPSRTPPPLPAARISSGGDGSDALSTSHVHVTAFAGAEAGAGAGSTATAASAPLPPGPLPTVATRSAPLSYEERVSREIEVMAQWGFVIRRVKPTGGSCSRCSWQRHCLGCPIFPGDMPGLNLVDYATLAIDWDPVRCALHLFLSDCGVMLVLGRALRVVLIRIVVLLLF